MWERQSSIRIWAGTRLHPDLGAVRLGQDLSGPARILMLDCLCPVKSKIGQRGRALTSAANHKDIGSESQRD